MALPNCSKSYWIKCAGQAFYCLSGFVLFLISLPSYAHVKWFSPYDVRSEPKAIDSVMADDSFLYFALISFAIVFVFSLVDRLWAQANDRILDIRGQLLKQLGPDFEFTAIRYALIIFFTSVWTLGNVVLTPELKHNTMWISALQLVIIVSLISTKTAKFAGYGIFGLWGYSAYYYGFFHLSDYMIFLGLAVFLILYSSYPQSTSKLWRYLILYVAISITLQWASIEKFVYPHWSFPILEERPYLRLGMDKEAFMNFAGVVEFLFAFLLIAVTGISFMMVTLGLAVMFILAIFDFGKIDAIGHLGIIVSLFVMAIHGPSGINLRLANLSASPTVNAFYVAVLYSISLVLFFALYYGVRNLWLASVAH